MEDKTNSQMCDCKNWGGRKRIWKIVHIILLVTILIAVIKISGRAEDKNAQDTIVVNGKGEVITKPDLATVSFSVMQEDKDVSKASDAVNKKIADIVNDLEKNQGVNENDIKTTGYNIYPRYDYINNGTFPNNGRQVLAGYDVTQSIEVKIRDLSKSGEIVSRIAGFNVTDLSGLNFTNDKYDDLVRQARDGAIADARSQAGKLAKALGVRLVKIVAFSENGNYPIPYGMGGGFTGIAAKESIAPAVLPTGENKITSNVSITYEIR